MFIETEPTPNPRSLKFIPDRPVLEKGTMHFTSPDEAKASPLAQAIFEFPEVNGVLLAPTFVSVTLKEEKGDWEELRPEILGAILSHFSSGAPVVLEKEVKKREAKPKESGEEDTETVKQIKAVLEEKVRPAVAQDGGDVIFAKFEDGVVYLYMQGACSGCPSSVYTLKNGIENLLKYYIPEVTEVRPLEGEGVTQ